LATNWYTTLFIYVPIVRNRVKQLEFTLTKTDFSERGLALIGFISLG